MSDTYTNFRNEYIQKRQRPYGSIFFRSLNNMNSATPTSTQASNTQATNTQATNTQAAGVQHTIKTQTPQKSSNNYLSDAINLVNEVYNKLGSNYNVNNTQRGLNITKQRISAVYGNENLSQIRSAARVIINEPLTPASTAQGLTQQLKDKAEVLYKNLQGSNKGKYDDANSYNDAQKGYTQSDNGKSYDTLNSHVQEDSLEAARAGGQSVAKYISTMDSFDTKNNENIPRLNALADSVNQLVNTYEQKSELLKNEFYLALRRGLNSAVYKGTRARAILGEQ